MESPIHTAERVTAEVLPKLYAHIGRVCAYELQHEFGVEPEHVSRVLITLEGRGWLSDPLAHAHQSAARNLPAYFLNKLKIVADHQVVDDHFRSVASSSLLQVYEETAISRRALDRDSDNPFAAATYHGGIALLASKHDLRTKNHWLGGLPGWTSFVDLSLLRSQHAA